VEPPQDLAWIPIVHRVAHPDVPLERAPRRGRENPVRRAHTNFHPNKGKWVTTSSIGSPIEAPWIEVATTDSYEPECETTMAFVTSSRT
jgi:hypothetical protein